MFSIESDHQRQVVSTLRELPERRRRVNQPPSCLPPFFDNAAIRHFETRPIVTFKIKSIAKSTKMLKIFKKIQKKL